MFSYKETVWLSQQQISLVSLIQHGIFRLTSVKIQPALILELPPANRINREVQELKIGEETLILSLDAEERIL